MSLVQAVITENFVLIGADKRATNSNGTICETVNKIVKLNNNIIFGCTGNVLDNFKLFDGFCYCHSTKGFINSDDVFDISYNDFVDVISNKFTTMYKEHVDINIKKHYDITSIICGFNGVEFEATVLSLGSIYDVPDGIIKVRKSIDFPYKGVTAGKLIHNENLHKEVYEICHKYGNPNILHYKNAMRNVFCKGAKIDNTINNIVCFEKIRKKDVVI